MRLNDSDWEILRALNADTISVQMPTGNRPSAMRAMCVLVAERLGFLHAEGLAAEDNDGHFRRWRITDKGRAVLAERPS